MSEHCGTMAFKVHGISRAALARLGITARYGLPQVLRPLPLVVGLFCLETALFFMFATRLLDMRAYLTLHFALCVTTAMFGRRWIGAASAAGDGSDQIARVLQLAGWTTLAGPFGTLVATALFVPRGAGVSDAEATTDTMTDQPELTSLERLHGSLLDSRLRLGGAHAIRPLLDVILEGTQTEKFDALSLLSKRYEPSLAPTLRRALEDRDGSVRVLAATVMAQRHNAYTKRIGTLQATARAALETSGHWCDLGQAHFDYARSGLLDPSRTEVEISHALNHLTRAIELDPGNVVTKARLEAVRRFSTHGEQPTVVAHDFFKGGKDSRCDKDRGTLHGR